MKSRLPIVLILFVFAIYFLAFFQFALNIPKWDDFALIKTISDFQSSHGFSEKWEILSKQHNEHRIVLTRVFALLDYWIFGELNFVHLMFLGSLALVAIFWTFIDVIYQTKKDVWIGFCLSIFWFSLAFYENTFWGMAAVQNFWIVAIILILIYLLAFSPQKIGLILCLLLLSIFTSGNGLLTIPLVLFSYFLHRQYRFLVYSLLFSAIVIFLYFYQYAAPLDVPSANHLSITDFIKGIIVMCGSMLEGIPMSPQLMFGLGIFLLVCTSYLIVNKLFNALFQRKSLAPIEFFILLGLIFALTTCLLVSFSRSSVSGPDSLILSRYKPYSALIISLLLIELTRKHTFNKHFIFRFGLVLFSLFCYISWEHYFLKNVIDQRRFLNSISFNWGNLSKPGSAKSKHEIYHQPSLYLDHYSNYRKSISIQSRIENVSGNVPFILNLDKLSSQNFLDEGPYFILVNESHCYILPFIQGRKHSIRNVLNYTRFYTDLATCTLNLKETEIVPGNYLIQMLNNHQISSLGNRVLNIPAMSTSKNLSNW
ncbi:MAG: hypothetical protein ACKOWQ_00825 [Aquirufa sp.]